MRVEVDVASEYRYRNPIVGADDLDRRDLAVGRDRRHARRDAASRAIRGGARARADQRDGLAGDARRRRGALHPRRARGRRRRDEDLRLPGRRDVPAGAAPRRAARDARSPSASRSSSASCGGCRRSSRSCSRASQPEVEAIAEWCWQAPFFLYIGRQAGDADRARGRAEAQGDLLHLDRRLRGRRDEARTDRAARRAARRSSASRRPRRCCRRSCRTSRRCARAARR